MPWINCVSIGGSKRVDLPKPIQLFTLKAIRKNMMVTGGVNLITALFNFFGMLSSQETKSRQEGTEDAALSIV